MKSSLRLLCMGVMLMGLALGPIRSGAQHQQPLPFDGSTWTGNHWCFNVNKGPWFPTVFGDQRSATFKDASGDYCWNEVRTSSFIEQSHTVVFDVQPHLTSGGTNPDSAFFGFGPTWFSCCAQDLLNNGWFSGIGLDSGRILATRFVGPPNYVEMTQIGTYQPRQWLTVRLTPLSGGVLVKVGDVSTTVPWALQTDQTPKRFIAVESNSVDGMVMRSVTLVEPNQPAIGVLVREQPTTFIKPVPMGISAPGPDITVARFEDPDNRVVCYLVLRTGSLSCLKK